MGGGGEGTGREGAWAKGRGALPSELGHVKYAKLWLRVCAAGYTFHELYFIRCTMGTPRIPRVYSRSPKTVRTV